MKGWSGGGKELVVSGDGAQDLEQIIYHTEIIVVDEQSSGTATGDTPNYGALLPRFLLRTQDWRLLVAKNCKVFSKRRRNTYLTIPNWLINTNVGSF